MTEEKNRGTESFPTFKKGYQPGKEPKRPSKPEPKGGYQPAKGEGDHPTNKPTPPKEE